MKFSEWIKWKHPELTEEFGIGTLGVAGTAAPLPGKRKIKIRKIDRPEGLDGYVDRGQSLIGTRRDPG